MFEITKEKLKTTELLTLRNRETGEYVNIIPELGGTVYQIGLQSGGNLFNLLEQDSPEELLKNPLYRGRILFPFNDRIPDGKYRYQNQLYQLPINDKSDQSAIHGFLYNQCLIVSDKSTNPDRCSLTLSFQSKKGQFKGYPFSVGIIIKYTLSNSGFNLEFKVTNFEEKKAPMAIGWHPYFKMGDSIEDLKLQIQANRYIEVDKQLNPTLNFPSIKGSNFDFNHSTKINGTELDIALSELTNSQTILTNNHHQLIVEQDPVFFKYTQLYIPEDRKSIAIEPITSATNSFNHKELGLVELDKNQTLKSFIKVSLNEQPKNNYKI